MPQDRQRHPADLWARSSRRAGSWGNGRWVVLSELGAVSVLVGYVDDGHSDTPAGSSGVPEEATGSVRRRWLPVWAWAYKGDRFVAVQWWAIAATFAAPAVLGRRRRGGGRGFEVVNVRVKRSV